MRRIGTVALASAVICVGLLFPHPAYGQVFQCERPTTCVTCRIQCATGPAVCADVHKNAYCSCRNNPNPYIQCEATDACHYTGATPSCENPTPAGECPNEGPGFSDPGGGDAATSKLAEPAQSEPTNNNAQSGSL
jgi:hypothetical protein